MRVLKLPLILSFCLITSLLFSFDFVIIKYKNGDSYNAKDGVTHFLAELSARTDIQADEKPVELSLEEDAVFSHFFLFLNGHMPIHFDETEKINLKRFIDAGGFVIVNDDFGMDESFRKEISAVFPQDKLTEIPFSHPLYHCFYDFKEGLPKIHEHYPGAPKAYGIIRNGKIRLLYVYNADIADGWDAPEVHNDPPALREAAIRMGVNIVVYALSE